MYIANRTEGRPGTPLLLTFHGTGGDENQFHGLGQQILPEAHIVSPRGDVSEMGHARFFRRTGEGVYDMDDLAQRTSAMATFIAEEKARTGADRVMALGYSNGANILASVALSQPALVDDLVLLHPLIPWAPAPQPGLANRRVLITAGERDPICPPAQTQALEAYLKAQGAKVETLWHPGGHEIAQAEIQRAAEVLQAELPQAAAL